LGKGSTRRPLLISEQEAEDNWNKIFGNKKYNFQNLKETIKEHNQLFEVEKRFLNGVSKPNESQFDGDKPNAVKS
jgi:hypothetical protein